jgi:hypothetical protein
MYKTLLSLAMASGVLLASVAAAPRGHSSAPRPVKINIDFGDGQTRGQVLLDKENGIRFQAGNEDASLELSLDVQRGLQIHGANRKSQAGLTVDPSGFVVFQARTPEGTLLGDADRKGVALQAEGQGQRAGLRIRKGGDLHFTSHSQEGQVDVHLLQDGGVEFRALPARSGEAVKVKTGFMQRIGRSLLGILTSLLGEVLQ